MCPSEQSEIASPIKIPADIVPGPGHRTGTPSSPRPPCPPLAKNQDAHAAQLKKKRSIVSGEPSTEQVPSKKPKISHQYYDPIAYWAEHLDWPSDFPQPEFTMYNSVPCTKKRSQTTHLSEKYRRLADHGVYLAISGTLPVPRQQLYDELLKEETRVSGHSSFPRDRLGDVLQRVQYLNEARIFRDITPWIVPSAELLYFCGETGFDYIGEEVNTLWSRCESMGSTIPKPDYTAGIMPSAFTRSEVAKLHNYSVSRKPAFFTPSLCFPFLVCEVKSPLAGLSGAEIQNIHSGSIAARAILELYKTAFGPDSQKVKDLSGQALVFSVSHDHNTVSIECHYGVFQGKASDAWKFYSDNVDLICLRHAAKRFTSYNFVRNVYDRFAPQHLKRIRDAIAVFPDAVAESNASQDTAEMVEGWQ